MSTETDLGQLLVGPGLEDVRRRIVFLARLRIPVLILGESGTGKELAARGLALLSGRPVERFISVNAATLADSLAESLLFGHVRGAFTGAVERREGLFEAARGGTLFLDEIADMTPAVQAKFLRILEETCYTPVGDTRAIAIDARFIFATNGNLQELAGKKRFREDLLHRLLGSVLEIPPLRRRRNDIRSLAEHFIAHFAREFGMQPVSLSPGAIRLMERHSWLGNVRQLKNFISLAMQEFPGQELSVPAAQRMLRRSLGIIAPSAGSAPTRRNLMNTMRGVDGNVSEAARRLGISRQHVYRLLRAAGLRPPAAKRQLTAAQGVGTSM